MNVVFQAAFESELATIERVTDPQSTPSGWGCDLSCTDDVTEDFAELDGTDPLVVAQYTYRRLITKAGQLADDPDWGIDIEEMLHKGITPKDLVKIRNTLRGEIARDDRLRDVVTDASYNVVSEALTITIGAAIVDSGDVFILTAVVNSSGSNLTELLINASAVPVS